MGRPLTVCNDNQHEDISFVGGDCPLCEVLDTWKATREEYHELEKEIKVVAEERDALLAKLNAYETDIRQSVMLARTIDAQETIE